MKALIEKCSDFLRIHTLGVIFVGRSVQSAQSVVHGRCFIMFEYMDGQFTLPTLGTVRWLSDSLWLPGIHCSTISTLPSLEWSIQLVPHKCWQWSLGSPPSSLLSLVRGSRGATRDAGLWEIPAHGFRDVLLGLHSSGKLSASGSSVHSRCPDITNLGG